MARLGPTGGTGFLSPTGAYKAQDIDATTNNITYYGFTNAEGEWYILREDNTTNKVSEFRYAAGPSDYPTAWTNRASQSYDYYDNVY